MLSQRSLPRCIPDSCPQSTPLLLAASALLPSRFSLARRRRRCAQASTGVPMANGAASVSPPSSFGLSPFPPVARWSTTGMQQVNRRAADPFQPTLGFASFDGLGANVSPSRSIGTAKFAVAFPGFAAPAWPSAAGHDQPQADLSPLFPMSASQQSSATVFELPSGASAPGAPTFSELMHGNPRRRSASPFEPMHPSQKSFLPAAAFSDSFQPPPLSALITSDLGNGVLFSAGANDSGHSMAGAPAAGLGPSAGAKHPGASVGLKLSF
jgi:hypothetical protein